MSSHTGRHGDKMKSRAFLWGAAHALDMSGQLLWQRDWRGFSADAEALNRDWRVVLNRASEQTNVAEADEEE